MRSPPPAIGRPAWSSPTASTTCGSWCGVPTRIRRRRRACTSPASRKAAWSPRCWPSSRRELFSSALAACAPIGSFRQQVNYLGDFRVLFDYFFPGVLPGSPVAMPADAIPAIWPAPIRARPAISARWPRNPAARARADARLARRLRPGQPADRGPIGDGTSSPTTSSVLNDAQRVLGGNPLRQPRPLVLRIVERPAAEPARPALRRRRRRRSPPWRPYETRRRPEHPARHHPHHRRRGRAVRPRAALPAEGGHVGPRLVPAGADPALRPLQLHRDRDRPGVPVHGEPSLTPDQRLAASGSSGARAELRTERL